MLCDSFFRVFGEVIKARHQLKILNIIMPGVAILVVNVVPLRDWAVVVFPHDAVEPFIVPAKIPLAWVEMILFSVKDLRRYNSSVAHSA